MPKIRLLYLGTSGIAIPLLQALSRDERFEVVLVVTGKDQPAGRKMELKPSAVKEAAEKCGLPVFDPSNINDKESVEKMRSMTPDFLVLFAYGQLLSRTILEIPKGGCVNVHPSLLSRHRGATPVQSAILAGDSETGISVMQMVEKMDAGPLYAQFSMRIAPEDNAISLSKKLAELAAAETPEVLAQIFEDKLKGQSQDDKHASYCTKMQKTDGQIQWSEPGELIARKVRAYAGWPGTWTMWNGKLLKILEGKVKADSHPAGQVQAVNGNIVVGTGKGSLELITIQLEGKRKLPVHEFIKGYPSFIGSTL